jgi:putative two-component system hydrogenase maturation factor HypX/HoxX
MKVMVLCSSFNALSQRVWLDLRAAGLEVQLHVGGDADAQQAAVAAFDPELVVGPFLRERVPAQVWRRWRTIVIHPGPLGDRGPSSLDWAITEGVRWWGVTAIQAVEELDAGPVWATRTFPMPPGRLSKSSLYNGPVADAAVTLVREVVAKAADPGFAPRVLDLADPDLPGRWRPAMRRSDRAFCWSDRTAHIVARVCAADGSPGVAATLRGQPVSVFDARPGPDVVGAEPGDIVERRHGGVLVRSGDGSVWIGQIRPADASPSIKLPATLALAEVLASLPTLPRTTIAPVGRSGFREIGYRRLGRVGILSFDFYNGAMTTDDCLRLAAAVRRAASCDTRVLVIRGGPTFSNGIHLGVVDADPDPAAAAWANINAIDDLCREIITTTSQLVVTAVTGNAGAGGVMLALGADRVLLRDGVVLNPHYATMG